jgi:hypothetical protein
VTECGIKDVFKFLNAAFSEFDSSFKHLSIDEVMVLCKKKGIFRQCILRKHQCFEVEVREFC